ncbi:MAG: hypothetical protein HY820_05895 [Acidobacteria bacterium]|nr:hypothetical protein [Acidobacteriota bacterium]
MKHTVLAVLILSGVLAQAQPSSEMMARIRGGGGLDGKCTIEVEVDDTAEIQIAGDIGRVRSLTGGISAFRRFECTSPMPSDMADFRFRGVDGRGQQVLLRDPRINQGWAVVRIEDRRGGRERYTFDLEWRGAASSDRSGYVPPLSPAPTRVLSESTVGLCQDAVSRRLERDGYYGMYFEGVSYDNNPGRHDWIVGSVDARRGGYNDRFSFSCSVDFNDGRVRTVDMRRR